MKRFHVHVAVDDLTANIRFYSAVFGAQPTVQKEDYAKWMMDDPRVNFAISRRGAQAGLDHLGIQVETDAELSALRGQVGRAQIAAADQPGADCCYARSDRYWTVDPQGIAWETFHTLDAIPVYGRAGRRSGSEARDHGVLWVVRYGRQSDRGIARVLLVSTSFSESEDGATRSAEPALRVFNVLFLCTGNSARSVMAEALLNALGEGRFRAYSAGSHPAGKVNPYTLEFLGGNAHSVAGLRSKSWDEFARPGAPRMDFVITVCDNAAGEVCPVWPGQPMTAHWGFQDPAALEGSDDEKRRLFHLVYQQIANRIRIFLNLPLDRLDRLSLQQNVRDLGKATS